MQIKRINLIDSNGTPLEGIEWFLGPTASKIMRELWLRPRSLKELHLNLNAGGIDIAYSTVHTDLNRLVAKKILKKVVVGYNDVIYRPVHKDEDAFLKDALHQLDLALRDNFSVSIDYA